MPQYGFKMWNQRDGSKHTVYCAAPKEYWAYLQVEVKYGPEFVVARTACEERPDDPVILGAIRALDMKAQDVACIERMIAER